MNKNIKLILNYVAGPLIMLFLFYTVVHQLHRQPNWKKSVQQIWLAATGTQRWKLYLMIAGMTVNWGLEAFKWQIALRNIQPVSFFRAYKAILAGTCIASFTPNRVGEYLGRMLFVDAGKKVLSVAPTILCSMAQMMVTLLASTAGLYLYGTLSGIQRVNWPMGLSPAILKPALVVSALAFILTALLYFRFDPLVARVNRWLKKNRKDFTIPTNFSLPALAGLLLLSVIRYAVFVLQYLLLFSLFGIPLSGLQVYAGVSVMFLLMALVPTLTFLTDLGFRWAAGIQIFEIFTSNTAGILAVSLGIWIINLIIPAFVGSLLILRIKLFSNR